VQLKASPQNPMTISMQFLITAFKARNPLSSKQHSIENSRPLG